MGRVVRDLWHSEPVVSLKLETETLSYLVVQQQKHKMNSFNSPSYTRLSLIRLISKGIAFYIIRYHRLYFLRISPDKMKTCPFQNMYTCICNRVCHKLNIKSCEMCAWVALSNVFCG